MSEERPNRPGGVRRIGEKDRKNRLDSTGSLFPPEPSAPADAPPPTLPEDLPEAETSAETAAPISEGEVNLTSDRDAAASPEEAEAEVEQEEAEVETETPDEHARFRRPVVPVPYDAPQDRFPPLPDEQMPQPRRKLPQRPQATPAPHRRGGWVLNCLTLIFLLGTCGLVGAFAYLWQNPHSALNPFPPFTPPPIVVTQTFTPSMTFTPTETPSPTRTPTPQPTDTPTPAATNTPEADSVESAESTEAAGAAFSLQGGQTIYITNPEARGGCRWSSIAGTVSDASGGALNEYQIRVLGDGVDETAISGTASGYGPGGFEVQLGSEAVDAEYAVQLFDPSGAPVSDALTVSTNSRCDWNISVLRFVQNPS